ncbi:hypothetical protein EW026_g7295 [Hermanssonia centrifuga]|uniref:Uncharacterized protein n=1 Tax=Hermanssonia centrifuga TaxID=98765 RepID=A0A4S4K899_9APHY|nr:hypothetical protein EW026_g7295 [Hermanssonia centrifuga]
MTEGSSNVKEVDGCTCGSCIDGWLSPRMKERLEVPTRTGEADFLHFISTSLLEDLDDLPDGEAIPEWCVAANASLHYIPLDLADKITPAFYRGYALVLETILQMLLLESEKAKLTLPTLTGVFTQIDEILASTEPDSDGPKRSPSEEADAQAIRAFFAGGGKIEFGLEAVVDRALEKSPEGSEYRRKAEYQQEEAEFEKEVQALPSCAHDLDFDLVRKSIGLVAEKTGPHWFFLTDDEEDDDEDEDDDEADALYEGQQASDHGKYFRPLLDIC